jgi:uncharacterized protein YbjT (DUF2867 family)
MKTKLKMNQLTVLFFMIISSIMGSKVLVVGGTGRVGRVVVSKLISNGINTVCLVRNIEKASSTLELLGAQLIQGDVTNIDDLIRCSSGCSSVIDVHGVSPPRFSKISDLFVHPLNDINHPVIIF